MTVKGLTVVQGDLPYVSSERVRLHCSEPSAIGLAVPRADWSKRRPKQMHVATSQKRISGSGEKIGLTHKVLLLFMNNFWTHTCKSDVGPR